MSAEKDAVNGRYGSRANLNAGSKPRNTGDSLALPPKNIVPRTLAPGNCTLPNRSGISDLTRAALARVERHTL